jgi:hypothetical protein
MSRSMEDFISKPEQKMSNDTSSGIDKYVTVTVRVLAMLEIYFVSVNYVFVSIKLMYVHVKLLKI